MTFLASLPLLFLTFWFYDTPKGLLRYFISFNYAFLQMFSLPLLIRTYFQPWKNEYHKGLVFVAILIGIIVKTFVIIADLMILVVLLVLELLILITFIVWPFATIYLLFIPKL